MDKIILMKALENGKQIFTNPEPLYDYDEIITGTDVRGKKMKAVANNTFMAFGYPLNENAKKVKSVYEDYFISNKSEIIKGLISINSLEDMDNLERKIYKDIYLKLVDVKAEKLDSYNRIRKPISLYLEHIISMCNLIDNTQRKRIVKYMFLPMDKFIFSSPYIFSDYEKKKWHINSNSGFGVVRTEELFYEMQNCLIERVKIISNELNDEFYRIYFDMFWGNRIESKEANLFLSNLSRDTHESLIGNGEKEILKIKDEKVENELIKSNAELINRASSFKELKGDSIWSLDEFVNIIEHYFGKENNVFKIIKEIYNGLEQVKGKINVKKRKRNDAVIRFEEGGNIVTFWFNNDSISIRVVGDAVFDKQRTITNLTQLEKLNVVDIISKKARLM